MVLADMYEIEDELHKLEVENRKREVFKCLYLNEFEKVKMY